MPGASGVGHYSRTVFKRPIQSTEAHGTEVIRAYRKGDLICQEGESSAEMFVIRRGAVRVFKASARGEIELATLEKGDFFGEMSVLESLPRDASAEALGDAEVLVMTPGALLVRLRRDPTFAFELLRRLSGRVRNLNARLVAQLGSNADLADSRRPDALLYAPEGKEQGGAP